MLDYIKTCFLLAEKQLQWQMFPTWRAWVLMSKGGPRSDDFTDRSVFQSIQALCSQMCNIILHSCTKATVSLTVTFFEFVISQYLALKLPPMLKTGL